MPIEPGLLNQPVVIEEATGQDEYGSQLIWTKVCATTADIQTATGSASTESKPYTGEPRYAVTISCRGAPLARHDPLPARDQYESAHPLPLAQGRSFADDSLGRAAENRATGAPA